MQSGIEATLRIGQMAPMEHGRITNGKVPGGSGEIWHYKYQWVGSCGADYTPLPDGGYCILGQFEVIMSQGTVANVHIWDIHAIPAGYGS